MGERIMGYKATDKYMICEGHKFELGVWYEVEGDLEMCKNGFHFCKYPSGPRHFYSNKTDRVFKVEAEEVLDLPEEPGADYKLVARRILLIEEIFYNDKNDNTGRHNIGDNNTGQCNTGYFNSGNLNIGNRNNGCGNVGNDNVGHDNNGDSNTGNNNVGNTNTRHGNSGRCNSGNNNTGNCNTGNANKGNRNSGDDNIGDRNTGNSNVGCYNKGHHNTGWGNTGHCNAGDNNTGNYNITNDSSGFFGSEKLKIDCFNKKTEYTLQEFNSKFGKLSFSLYVELRKKEKINYEDFKDLPNITPKRLRKLHKAFLERYKNDTGS